MYFPSTDLERSLPVAEQIVGGTEPRREVVHALAGDGRERKVARGLQRRGTPVLFRISAAEAVVAQTGVDRPAVDRPAILHVDAELSLDQRLTARRHAVQRHLVRDAVVEAELHVGRVRVGRAHRVRPRIAEAHLEGVRTGHVRHRGDRGVDRLARVAEQPARAAVATLAAIEEGRWIARAPGSGRDRCRLLSGNWLPKASPRRA